MANQRTVSQVVLWTHYDATQDIIIADMSDSAITDNEISEALLYLKKWTMSWLRPRAG